MNNFRKFCHLSRCVLMDRNFNICVQKNMKSVFSVHTSSEKITDASHSQKSNVLVYKAPLKTRIKVVKYLSLGSSMIGFALLPSVMIDLGKTSVLLACAAGTVSTFFLSTPFMLHWITKRYVLELHFDYETKIFTAKTFNIVNQITETKFKATDVTVPDLPGMLSSFLVNRKPLFVDANMVQDPDAYSHMMGYDKPFDIAIKVNKQNDITKAT